VLGKNVAFASGHADELQKLAGVGIADEGALGGIGGCCPDRNEVDKLGPLGIWRTP
jgi:hypothetical protein